MADVLNTTPPLNIRPAPYSQILVLVFGLPALVAPNVLPSDRTQRQVRELILGPRPGAKTGPLSFNRTQPRVVIGRRTGHNTLRRHIYLMRANNCPTCRRYAAEDETSTHTLCECGLWLHMDIHIWAPFLWKQNTLRV